jgi:hypothetical protein
MDHEAKTLEEGAFAEREEEQAGWREGWSVAEAEAETDEADRVRGSFLGLAWGDVFGCPVEGWRSAAISKVSRVFPPRAHVYFVPFYFRCMATTSTCPLSILWKRSQPPARDTGASFAPLVPSSPDLTPL